MTPENNEDRPNQWGLKICALASFTTIILSIVDNLISTAMWSSIALILILELIHTEKLLYKVINDTNRVIDKFNKYLSIETKK